MNIWKYERGEWTACTDLDDWRDNETLEEVLARHGVEARFGYVIGAELGHLVPLTIYCMPDYQPPFWIDYCLDLSELVCLVSIPTFPDLMEWIRAYAPSLLLAQIASLLEDLHETGGKAFRAWHGHGRDGFCLTCDPAASQRKLERERYRQGRSQ